MIIDPTRSPRDRPVRRAGRHGRSAALPRGLGVRAVLAAGVGGARRRRRPAGPHRRTVRVAGAGDTARGAAPVVGGYAVAARWRPSSGCWRRSSRTGSPATPPIFDDGWDLLTPTGPAWLAIVLLAAGLAVAFGGPVWSRRPGPSRRGDPVTSLILALLAARRAQTLIVTLLALFATAGAVAGPAYQLTAERAVVDAEVATSSPRNAACRSSIVPAGPLDAAPSSPPGSSRRSQLRRVHHRVRGASTTSPPPVRRPRRDSPASCTATTCCAHVVIRAGRCPSGAREVILGRRTAEGSGSTSAPRCRSPPRYLVPRRLAGRPSWTPISRWSASTTRSTPTEPYWAGRTYFGGTDRAAPEPAFVAEPTLEPRPSTSPSATRPTSSPGPDTFTPAGSRPCATDLDQLSGCA